MNSTIITEYIIIYHDFKGDLIHVNVCSILYLNQSLLKVSPFIFIITIIIIITTTTTVTY